MENNLPSVEGIMQKVKEWSGTHECDKPYNFLKAAVSQYSFGDWGLNQLAFIHYPHVAKVMHDYTAELQSQLAQRDKEISKWEELYKSACESYHEAEKENDELEKQRDHYKALAEKCWPYIEELQAENHHEPNVGIFHDQKLTDLYQALRQTPITDKTNENGNH